MDLKPLNQYGLSPLNSAGTARTGEIVRAITKPVLGRFSNAAFSPDGRNLAVPGVKVEFWDVRTGEPLDQLNSYLFNLKMFLSITRAVFSSDGKRFAMGTRDGKLRVLTMPGMIRRRANLFWKAPRIQRWLESDYATSSGHIGPVTCLAFSPDRTRLVSSGEDGTVKIWDATTGQEILALRGHTGAVNSVAFSPDGHRIISGGSDGTVRIWDATPVGFALNGKTDGGE